MGLTNIIKKTLKTSDKVDDIYVSLTGNRMTVLSHFAIAYGIGMMGGAWRGVGDDPICLLSCLSGAVIYTGGLLASINTCCGRTTPWYYKETEEHIKHFGKLDERFARNLIQGSENGSFVGYCQQQGLYLAARKHGQLGVFRQAQKKYSKIKIPFF